MVDKEPPDVRRLLAEKIAEYKVDYTADTAARAKLTEVYGLREWERIKAPI